VVTCAARTPLPVSTETIVPAAPYSGCRYPSAIAQPTDGEKLPLVMRPIFFHRKKERDFPDVRSVVPSTTAPKGGTVSPDVLKVQQNR